MAWQDAFDHHGPRVAVLAMILAREAGLSEHEVDMMRVSGSLHDIGKLNISPMVLNAPRVLMPGEYENVKRHPNFGFNMLKNLGYDPIIYDVILHHHEHWDGSGYPDGLKGSEISIHAAITTIVDVYDAMTNPRAYRPMKSYAATKAEMMGLSGKWFNPDLLNTFFEKVITHG